MANACQAEIIPATDGVAAAICAAPCEDEYCTTHSYLDEFADYESEEFKSYADYVGDPDNAFDIEREREWDLA